MKVSILCFFALLALSLQFSYVSGMNDNMNDMDDNDSMEEEDGMYPEEEEFYEEENEEYYDEEDQDDMYMEEEEEEEANMCYDMEGEELDSYDTSMTTYSVDMGSATGLGVTADVMMTLPTLEAYAYEYGFYQEAGVMVMSSFWGAENLTESVVVQVKVADLNLDLCTVYCADDDSDVYECTVVPVVSHCSLDAAVDFPNVHLYLAFAKSSTNLVLYADIKEDRLADDSVESLCVATPEGYVPASSTEADEPIDFTTVSQVSVNVELPIEYDQTRGDTVTLRTVTLVTDSGDVTELAGATPIASASGFTLDINFGEISESFTAQIRGVFVEGSGARLLAEDDETEFFTSLYFEGVADDSDADADEMCDSTEIIKYLFSNENLLLVTPTAVAEEDVDEGVISFVHYIDVEFADPFTVSNLSMAAYFEELDANRVGVPFVINSNSHLQLSIPNEEFITMNIDKQMTGNDLAQYSAPLILSFYNECESNIVKEYKFDFIVEEELSLAGELNIVSNTVVDDENNDCDGGCVNEVVYEAELTLKTPTWDGNADGNTYAPNDVMYISFAVKQTIDRTLKVTSVKESLPNGLYTELVDNDYAFQTIDQRAGSVDLQVKVMLSQSFILTIEAELDELDEDGSRRRVMAEIDTSRMLAYSARKYYVGKTIQVVDPAKNEQQQGDDESNSQNLQTENQQDDPYKNLFIATMVLIVVVLVGYVAATKCLKNRKGPRDERTRFFEETEMSYIA